MSKPNFPGRSSDPPENAAGAAVGGGTGTAGEWRERASRHFVLGDNAAAARAARRGLLVDPGHAALTALEAFARQRLADLTAALRGARRAVALNPVHAGSWRLRGAVAYALGRKAEAIRSGRRALLLDPGDRPAAKNVFVGERERGDWTRAVRVGRWIGALAPESDADALNLGVLLLSLGRWSEGWPKYDRRLRVAGARPRPDRLPQPYWDGASDPGLGLAVWCDQNVGDEMQFAQLLPEVAARVGRVVLECDPRLVSLFARSFPGVEVVARSDPPDPRLTAPDVRAQIPQGHLGGVLRPDAGSFARGPRSWLAADPGRVDTLRARYRGLGGGRPVIGVSWRSINAAFQGKNLPLARWGPVLRAVDALFLSVQYGDVAADVAEAEAATGVAVVRDPGVDALADLDGFAAQLAATDLVISISNSTIHQACGLGRPVWGLLHIRPDWRWGVAGVDCPWFPSLRLYRQSDRGDWASVLAAVAGDLRRRLAEGSGAC